MANRRPNAAACCVTASGPNMTAWLPPPEVPPRPKRNQKRAARFNIRALTREEQTRFAARWQQVQAEFVENPKASLGHADDLLAGVMAARGYPVQDFDQRSADLSVDYPVVVQHYHAAHDIALRHKKGDATTEDMRQAMIHYRALFEDLVSDAAAVAPVAVNIPHAAE